MKPDNTIRHGIQASPHRLRLAAGVLANGGVVVHATEGVWGLAANAHDEAAVKRVLATKKRNIERGLIVVGATPEQLAPLVAPGTHEPWQRALASWPGPNTWLLPARSNAPHWLTGGQPTTALRQTDHQLTRALCQAFGGPIVSTSANVSGHPPVDSPWRARMTFRHQVDMILGGRTDHPGQASTIRHAVTDEVIRG